MTLKLTYALSTIEHLQASPLMANHRAGLDAAHQLLSALAQRPAAQTAKPDLSGHDAFDVLSGSDQSRASLPAPQQATPEPVGEPYTLIAMGFGRYEVGAGTNGGLPCVAFGRNGNGDVGTIVTEEPRQMTVDETIAAITFANVEGLNVLQEKMDEVRALYFSDTRPAAAPAVPEVDDLAQFIRQIDGKHSMGAGALADHICEWLAAAQAKGGEHE